MPPARPAAAEDIRSGALRAVPASGGEEAPQNARVQKAGSTEKRCSRPFSFPIPSSLGQAILPAGPARDGAGPLQAMLEALPKERQTPA